MRAKLRPLRVLAALANVIVKNAEPGVATGTGRAANMPKERCTDDRSSLW
jgi:hypothetical protein